MPWLWTILIGFVAGLLARMITRGMGPSGFWTTAILGIAGAVAATYAGQAMGFYDEGEPAGFVASVLGAVVLLIIYHILPRRSQS
ncbi:MAG: GlsB/YeaQ/YmgE family stress response membrane protein [Proteobacteria bacterium]|nr:GlsB/YeaQ/YmgE family stress response membrane protein [Pseudomonadota bacterium]